MEQDIDSSDSARRRFEEKHQASLEQIKRTKEESHKRREEDSDPQENRDRFESEFNSRLEGIRIKLSSLSSSDSVNDICEQLKLKLNECTELLNLSTHFLHPYTIKQSQQGISAALESINKTQTELAPRKKFAFSRAKPVKKEEEKKQELVHQQAVEIELEGIQNQSNQTFIKRDHELREINCYQLKDLTDCEVFLVGNLKAVHMLRLTRCRVYIGPVSGAAHISECKDSSISVACHQLRIHTSVNCKFYVHCPTNPIVESVSQAYFAPYNFNYDELPAHLTAASLDSENRWSNVQDFKWLKQTKSPNWDVLPESERVEYSFRES